MGTNHAAPIHTSQTTGAGQVVRAWTTTLCAAAFVLVMAFGAPVDHASRWNSDADAHSDIGYEVAIDTSNTNGE